MRVAAGLFDLGRRVFRPPETLRPLWGQPVAVLVQIHQREGCAYPLVVFPDAPIAHLGKSEDALEDAEWMLDFGSHASFDCVLALGLFVNVVFVFGPARSHILRLGCGCANRLGLALIAAIAPHLALLAVQ